MKRFTILTALIALMTCTSCADTVIYSEASNDQLVAATLILEAGGEKDLRAMIAVYEVIRNRAAKRKTALVDEAFRRKQFSCWNNVERRPQLFHRAITHRKYQRALGIVKSRTDIDITNGATHYHATYVNPYWASSLTKTTQFENHVFYK